MTEIKIESVLGTCIENDCKKKRKREREKNSQSSASQIAHSLGATFVCNHRARVEKLRCTEQGHPGSRRSRSRRRRLASTSSCVGMLTSAPSEQLCMGICRAVRAPYTRARATHAGAASRLPLLQHCAMLFDVPLLPRLRVDQLRADLAFVVPAEETQWAVGLLGGCGGSINMANR